METTILAVKGKTYLSNKINDFNGSITFKKAIAYVPKNQEEKTKVVLKMRIALLAQKIAISFFISVHSLSKYI